MITLWYVKEWPNVTFYQAYLWWHDLHLKSNNLYDEEIYPAWDSPLPTRLASNVNVKSNPRPLMGKY